MKRRIGLVALMIAISIGLVSDVAATGYNLVFPAARRYGITLPYEGNSPNQHSGTDYDFPNGTQVTAALPGRLEQHCVQTTELQCDDGDNPDKQPRESGCGFWTYTYQSGFNIMYCHLERYWPVAEGASVQYGQLIGRSSNSGGPWHQPSCTYSSPYHLHFELRTDWPYKSTAFNPYDDNGTNHWASGDPIPMGYRDEYSAVQGPYQLDYSYIKNKWLSLDGEPGSPLGNDFQPPPQEVQREQRFEHGYIHYSSSSGTTYYAYNEIYLPIVRADEASNGWNTFIHMRNDSGTTARVNITLYEEDGQVRDSRTYVPLLSNTVWTLDARSVVFDSYLRDYDDGSSFTGSAVVYASEKDVSVVVEARNAGANTAYVYNGVVAESGTGNAGFGKVGTTIHLPIMMRNYYDWYTAFTVQNAGTQQAQVTITYYNDSGGVVTSENVSIPVNRTIYRDQNGIAGFQPNRMYSAEIVSTNGQPLAVVVQQRKEASPGAPTSFQAYNGFSGEASVSYTPSLMKNYYGWASSLTVQNVGSGFADITVTYYTITGTVTEGAPNVPGKASRVFYQPNNSELPSGNQNGLFAARITASQNIAVVVNQCNGDLCGSYNGFQGGSGLSWQPRVLKNAGGWNSSVVAQNVGSGTTDITLTYDDGTWETRSGVLPYHHALFYQGNSPISDGEHWAKVAAGQRIVAIVNASGVYTNTDLAWSYNGFNR